MSTLIAIVALLVATAAQAQTQDPIARKLAQRPSSLPMKGEYGNPVGCSRGGAQAGSVDRRFKIGAKNIWSHERICTFTSVKPLKQGATDAWDVHMRCEEEGTPYDTQVWVARRPDNKIILKPRGVADFPHGPFEQCQAPKPGAKGPTMVCGTMKRRADMMIFVGDERTMWVGPPQNKMSVVTMRRVRSYTRGTYAWQTFSKRRGVGYIVLWRERTCVKNKTAFKYVDRSGVWAGCCAKAPIE